MIEYIYLSHWLAIGGIMMTGILACFLLKREIRKTKKYIAKIEIPKELFDDKFEDEKKSENHHCLINKKMPPQKSVVIQIDVKREKTNDKISPESLKFTVIKPKLKNALENNDSQKENLNKKFSLKRN